MQIFIQIGALFLKYGKNISQNLKELNTLEYAKMHAQYLTNWAYMSVAYQFLNKDYADIEVSTARNWHATDIYAQLVKYWACILAYASVLSPLEF
jgi:hypothetical protein